MNRGAIAAAAVLLGTPDAQAQDWSWFEQETATGDWGGARQRLVEAGVTPKARYTTDLLANPIGGARQGFAYAGNLEASLEFDLERLLGLDGSRFFVAASWRPVEISPRERSATCSQSPKSSKDSQSGWRKYTSSRPCSRKG
jgi:carbohydrate-selective porin OprB